MFYSRRLARFFRAIPGKKKFGVYRYLPLFFVSGALLEFTMINWHVGTVNFCMSITALHTVNIADVI